MNVVLRPAMRRDEFLPELRIELLLADLWHDTGLPETEPDEGP